MHLLGLRFLNVRQIVLSTHTLELNTRQILHPSSSHQHNMMLLQVVSNARHIGGSLPASAQSHSNTFPVCRIWFFRLLDERLEYNALQERTSLSWSKLFLCSLRRTILNDSVDVAWQCACERKMFKAAKLGKSGTNCRRF